jgi:hypothetical protein
MTLEKLYEIYGKLMWRAEVLNLQITDVKQKISAEMNKPQPPQPKPEGDNANPKASE